MFAALGLNYGDEEVTEFIMQLKQRAELDATIDLAIINGAFPDYNRDLEYKVTDPRGDIGGKNKFFNRILDIFPDHVDRMWVSGRRNISWSTINGGLIE